MAMLVLEVAMNYKVKYQKQFRGRRGIKKMWITHSEHKTEQEASKAERLLSKQYPYVPVRTYDPAGVVVFDSHALAHIFGVS